MVGILADMNPVMAARTNGLSVLKTDIIGSGTCSTCGWIPDTRMGTDSICGCPWHDIERAIAGTGLLHTAVSEISGMAGGLRFSPGAFHHDVMMVLYEPAIAARAEPNGTSCTLGV
ncbi:MAG: hypothetical protein A3K60_06225 [Euryarchaeota archaeon RBG_19FT_COMBO_56_21]|nr:MAG: hypothetical protein A3K60_06225 [Euryarchaeota archaeon RBG_19FT_COMBO_56_21]